jgi:hypothetical protein
VELTDAFNEGECGERCGLRLQRQPHVEVGLGSSVAVWQTSTISGPVLPSMAVGGRLGTSGGIRATTIMATSQLLELSSTEAWITPLSLSKSILPPKREVVPIPPISPVAKTLTTTQSHTRLVAHQGMVKHGSASHC